MTNNGEKDFSESRGILCSSRGKCTGWFTNSKQFRAFTLLELLVIISVIGLLGALLLPAFARAKAATVRVACMNNLKQIGTCLHLYLVDFGRYPAFQADARTCSRDGFWDSKLAAYANGKGGIFMCPANSGRGINLEDNWAPKPPPSVDDPLFRTWPNLSYGYNGTGTASDEDPVIGPGGELFLGFGGEDYTDGGRIFLPKYLLESQIVAPVNMIAVADYDPWATDDDSDADRHPEMLFLGLTGRHSWGANALFCDSHIECYRTNFWKRRSDDAFKRWNFDNQPHRNGKW